MCVCVCVCVCVVCCAQAGHELDPAVLDFTHLQGFPWHSRDTVMTEFLGEVTICIKNFLRSRGSKRKLFDGVAHFVAVHAADPAATYTLEGDDLLDSWNTFITENECFKVCVLQSRMHASVRRGSRSGPSCL